MASPLLLALILVGSHQVADLVWSSLCRCSCMELRNFLPQSPKYYRCIPLYTDAIISLFSLSLLSFLPFSLPLLVCVSVYILCVYACVCMANVHVVGVGVSGG